jgi:hypothetical protein
VRKRRLERGPVLAPERRDRVVIRVLIGGDKPHADVAIGRPLQTARGENTVRIAINQQRQHHPRMIPRLARAAVVDLERPARLDLNASSLTRSTAAITKCARSSSATQSFRSGGGRNRCSRLKSLKLAMDSVYTDLRKSDRLLVKALARGIMWYDDLTSGRATSLRQIAANEGVTERYVSKLIRFALLAPDLVERCLEVGPDLPMTAADINENVQLPASWARQRERGKRPNQAQSITRYSPR